MIIHGTDAIAQYLKETGIKGCIFDIDGTLIDSMGIWDELGERYLRSIHVDPEPGLAAILFPLSLEEGVQYLKNHYHLREAEEEVQQGITGILEHFYRQEVQLKPWASEFLASLQKQGMTMVLTTVGDAELEEAALKRTGIYGCFRKMLVCQEYHTSKREPFIYEMALEALHLQKHEAIVFEDVLQALSTASKAGFATAGVQDAASSDDWKAMQETADCWMQDFHILETLK